MADNANLSIDSDNALFVDTTSNRVGIGTLTPLDTLHLVDGALRVDGNNSAGLSLNVSGILYVNKSSGNVGIGTTSPSVKLDVAGNALIAPSSGDAYIRVLDSGIESWYLQATDGTSRFDIKDDDGSTYFSIDGTNGNVGINQTSPQTTLHVGASTFTVNTSSGNVGIGTTSPNETLHISAGSLAGARIDSSGDSPVIDLYQLALGNAAARNWRITTNYNAWGTLEFWQSTANDNAPSAARMVIDVSGEVGIGTISPGTELDIENSGDVIVNINSNDGNSAAISFENGSTDFWDIGKRDGNARFYIYDHAGGGGGNSEVFTILKGGNVGIGTTSPEYRLQISDVDKALNVSDVLYVNGSSGRVGIGTNDPGIGANTYVPPLTVKSSHNYGTYIAIKNSNTEYAMGGIWLQNVSDNAGWLFGTDNNGKAIFSFGSGASESAALTAAKDTLTGILIDLSGNVGIGNIAPESWSATWSALQIGGTLSLFSETTQAAGTRSYFGHNVYNDGAWKYISTNANDEASLITMEDGSIAFTVTSTAGAHDAGATFTTALTLENDGDAVFGKGIIGATDSTTATSEGVAASLTVFHTLVATNNDADLDNLTLADGTNGQIRVFTANIIGGSDTFKITPANAFGFSTITFDTDGESTIMLYSNSANAWVILSNNGGTIA